MMIFLSQLWSSMQIQLTSADLPGFMKILNKEKIPIYAVKLQTELTVRFYIAYRHYQRVLKLAEKHGAKLHIIKKRGIYFTLQNAKKRPVLFIGLLLLMIIVSYLPKHIYFVEVKGNQQIPSKLILDKAAECGIGFHATRREVRSEKVKNALLYAIPQLQWAAVNTKGCVAVISVKERAFTNDNTEKKTVSSIVAAKDGILMQCNATKGNLLCKVGQAVRVGDVLISGYTDCGILIRATRAEGEIFAQTKQQQTCILPIHFMQKSEITAVSKKYSIIFGKKRINFYKDSGILDSSCDKMYKQSYVTLLGGYKLPIAFVVEETVTYDTTTVSTANPMHIGPLQAFSQEYMLGQMISGTILESNQQLSEANGAYILQGNFTCREMIGRINNEEIMINHEQNN